MRCSCKRSAAILCTINLLAALYVLHLLLGSLVSREAVNFSIERRYDDVNPYGLESGPRFTQQELLKLKEAADARRAVEPTELMKRVEEMQMESSAVDAAGDAARLKVAEEAAQRLQRVQGNFGQTKEQPQTQNDEGIEEILSKPEESVSQELLEGGKLVLKGPEIEDGIIPGRIPPDVCNAEPHTDYDGMAVRWGLNHQQESAADCCQACLDQAQTAVDGAMKCNTWVYCPSEEGCFSPDVYEHKQFECWLKLAEKPIINFKGRYPPEYRQAHPTCPHVVPWVSGVISFA